MTEKEQWGTRVGLVLAMAGNAVGLGNFLRFPAQAAANGGGAFIIPYLVSFLLMGIPLLWVEWAIGRHGGQHGHHSAPGMLDVLGRGRFWKYLGVFGLFTNIAVAAFYCYIESWTLGYVWYSVSGAFRGMSAEQVTQHFTSYTDSAAGTVVNWPTVAIGFFLVTLALNVYILSRGLAKGIELVAKIGMPLLLAFGAFLAIRALTLEPGIAGASHSALEGLNYLWEPQTAELSNPKVWVAAVGQIFFTLSVGMGTIHCYASYLRKDDDVALNGAAAGWMNEFVEVILGASVVVPLATAYLGLDWVKEKAGFSMAFNTMPTLFDNWGPALSTLAGTMWFGLLFFAGVTSSLAMGQPVLAFLQDEFGHSRRKAAMLFGFATLLLALPCIVFYAEGTNGAFHEFDWWAGTVALVIFALAEVILFGWVFGIDKGWEEITRGADIRVPTVFKWVIKYVTPIFLVVVFLAYLVKPAGNEFQAAFASLAAGDGWPLAPDGILGSIFRVGVTDYAWHDASGGLTTYFVQDISRITLAATFLGLCLLVRKAWAKRRAEGRLS